LAVLVERRGGLGDDVVALLDGGQIVDVVRYHSVHHLAHRAFQEAVSVGAGIGGQRVDETDVRAFRRFDRAHATVVGRVHVAYFETGALAGQTTRPQRRDAALVGDFRQRVVLVHELRQLAGTEEFLDRGRHRLGVDQVLRHQAFAVGHGQTLLDRAFHTHQAHAKLVLGHLTHRTDAAVAEVVDVVDGAEAVADADQGLDDVDDVFLAQHALAFGVRAAQAAVELHAAHGRQ